VDVITAQLAVF